MNCIKCKSELPKGWLSVCLDCLRVAYATRGLPKVIVRNEVFNSTILEELHEKSITTPIDCESK